MLKKSDTRVWVYNDYYQEFYLLGAGLTRLEESYKTAILETPNIYDSFCKQEILHCKGQLEFEGFRMGDMAMETLRGKQGKTGTEAIVTLIIIDRKDAYGPNSTFTVAKRVKGYLCMENPGSGEGRLGSKIKGKVVYAQRPEEGIYDEERQVFG